MLSWMKSLVMYLILSGVLINLAPEKNYRKYINFFSGLVVIILVARPVFFILKADYKKLDNITAEMDYYLNNDGNIYDAGEMYNYYDMSLKYSISNKIEEFDCRTEKISVITDDDGNIMKLDICIEGSEDKEVIKREISNEYNVNIENINIISR